jgi:hypothetical protein
MKDRLQTIQLTNVVQPTVKEIPGQDWVQYGDNTYKNLFPTYLIDLYNNSATHAAIVNATAAMIAGEDILVDDKEDLTQYVELKKALANINSKETAHEVLVKCAFDLKLQGSYALNIIWSKDRTKIAEIYHIPVEQLRVGAPDEHGRVREYYLSADWSQYRKKEYLPKRIAAYNVQDRREASQILYTGLYSPAMEIYYTPDYVASTNWVEVDSLTADYHLNNIANGFSGSYFINFSNGIPTQEERERIELQIKRKFTGAHNAGKFVLTFTEDGQEKPEIIPIQVSNADKQYTVLNELCIQNIMIGHRVTSPMLLGVKTEGQLGGRNELTQAYELYMNTVVKPYQNNILKTFKKLLAVNGIVIPFSIKNVSPINSLFGSDVLKDVLTQDEIREQAGYEPLADNEQSVTEEVELNKQTLLDKLLTEYGEDEDLENWEIVDDADAENEHPDFDFEYNLEKLELATTGRAYPKAKSEQDGTDRQGNLYRVRYYYNEDKGLTREEAGNSREFCKKMMSATANGKVYRKEDILRMTTQPVNPGWGAGGADTYSIWLYKGGGNCHHRWYRRIYVSKQGERPTDTDRVISTAKARSEGFRPEPHPASERGVPIAPKRRADKGFIRR